MTVCAIGAMGLAALGMGGCGAQLDRASWRDGGVRGRDQWDGGGGSWALVMNSPRTGMMLAGVDASAMPEYARNDAALGYREEGPVLASNEWPERERPDLYYARRLQLETRADQVLYFDSATRYGGGGYRRGSSEGGSGTWGFWR